ncbi:MAG TPA: glycerophosphodiester phosphodiesterase [Candidatus Brachybacterium merdigallinarum]|nr:glycerophosphodiester phosphodiesterase [Candidatus Brachybacterium merdigallinarum]
MSTGWTAPGSNGPSETPGTEEASASATGPDPSFAPAAGANGAPARPQRELTSDVPLFPLRPMGLGEIFGAAVRIYRVRPKLVLGVSAITWGIAYALTTLLTGVSMIPMIGELQAISEDPMADTTSFGGSPGEIVLTVSSYVLTGAISAIASALVTVVLTLIAVTTAMGEDLPSAQIWARARRKLLPALGLSIMVGILLVVSYSIPAALGALPLILIQEASVLTIGSLLAGLVLGIPAVLWVWSLTLLAVPALVVEDLGAFAALRRSVQMAWGRRLWRVLGIGLLLLIVYYFAVQVITGVFGVVGTVVYIAILLASQMQALVLGITVLTVVMMVGAFLATFLLAPFYSAGIAALYADNRMRHEAWDVELNRRSREAFEAEHTAPTGPLDAPGPAGIR